MGFIFLKIFLLEAYSNSISVLWQHLCLVMTKFLACRRLFVVWEAIRLIKLDYEIWHKTHNYKNADAATTERIK